MQGRFASSANGLVVKYSFAITKSCGLAVPGVRFPLGAYAFYQYNYCIEGINIFVGIASSTRQWFSGKIQLCHTKELWISCAGGSIPPWRILFSIAFCANNEKRRRNDTF